MIEEAFNAALMKKYIDYMKEVAGTTDVSPYVMQNILYIKVSGTCGYLSTLERYVNKVQAA
jgi:hypothetical protein